MGGARRGVCGWFERVSSLFSFKERTARSPDEFRGPEPEPRSPLTLSGPAVLPNLRHESLCRAACAETTHLQPSWHPSGSSRVIATFAIASPSAHEHNHANNHDSHGGKTTSPCQCVSPPKPLQNERNNMLFRWFPGGKWYQGSQERKVRARSRP